MTAELQNALSVTEVIHGIQVIDTYRWLEDRNTDATERWLKEQQRRCKSYYRNLGPLDDLGSRVRSYVDIEQVDQVGMVNGRCFYRKRSAGEEQPSIVMIGPDHSEKVLVDPNSFGAYVSVGIYRISESSRFLAYELKVGGEHSKTVHIFDVESGITYPDFLRRGLARGFAFRRHDGFYYCHDFVIDKGSIRGNHMIMFHRYGTEEEEDEILLELPRTAFSKLILKSQGDMLGAVYTHELNKGSMGIDFYTSSSGRDRVWQRVCTNVPAPFIPFFYRGGLFARYYQRDLNGEIVELSILDGSIRQIVVPAWDAPIKQCVIGGDKLYVSYQVGMDFTLHVWSFDGQVLAEPALESGNTWSLLSKYAEEESEVFIQRESFNRPPAVYTVKEAALHLWHEQKIPLADKPIGIRRVSYPSKDGTEITMVLLGKDAADPTGQNPVILTAYGGFGLSLTPVFSGFMSVILDLGFCVALPEIRGGAERGTNWHNLAKKRQRQVIYDDFIAAAEWLCLESVTTPEKLAIIGGSNSGTLVGVAITQRPDLFGAALCIAPLLDMIRYHLFDLAHVWADEYGTSEDPDDFRALLRYSPYHNVKDQIDYPAGLFVSGDRDTRCNPAHARKMVARLVARSSQHNPIILDHHEWRGHSPTMPLSARIDGITNRIAFLCRQLDVPLTEGRQI
jgi:prolyl oligopeptidase